MKDNDFYLFAMPTILAAGVATTASVLGWIML